MNSIKILLVEDNEGDIVLTLEALSDAKLKSDVEVVRDGATAIDQLMNNKTRPLLLPDLILLDINLPRMDGKEVLQMIKNDDILKKIPVVMLTTSASEVDIKESYNNHANCFITKPVDLDKFFTVVKVIEEFWITIVKLPSKE